MEATANELRAALRELVTAIREAARAAQRASNLGDLDHIKNQLVEAANEAERVILKR